MDAKITAWHEQDLCTWCEKERECVTRGHVSCAITTPFPSEAVARCSTNPADIYYGVAIPAAFAAPGICPAGIGIPAGAASAGVA